MATIPASENEYPEVLFVEGAAPAAPATGLVKAYAKSDGLLYSKDDAGTETALGGSTTAHIADTTDAHDASAISFDPTGLSVVTATEVQTAIEELDAATGGSGAPSDATYLTTALHAGLSAEVVVKAPAANGAVPVVKHKTADESVSNTTLQDDDHLVVPIGASETWVATFTLFAVNAQNTGDIKLLPTAPAGATLRYGIVGLATGSTGVEADARFQSITPSTALPVGLAGGGAVMVLFYVYCANSTNAGNLTLQWAQNATDGSNATQVLTGSFVVAHRVA